jgi:acetyl-CoA C-acetyltransferase
VVVADRFIEEGHSLIDGDLPVSPSGGLLGAGHAVGATGVMQIGEVAKQLKGEAGERQVKIEKGRGLAHSIGGPGSSYATVTILGV